MYTSNINVQLFLYTNVHVLLKISQPSVKK